MSVKMMSLVWEIKGLLPAQKLILLKIADNADDRGSCFPSREYIAKKCECSTRTVTRAISHFEKLGILSHKRRFNKSNVYQFNTAKLSHTNAANLSQLEGLTRHPCPVNGDTHVPLTIKNHKEKEEQSAEKQESTLDSDNSDTSNTKQQVALGGTEEKQDWHGWQDLNGKALRRKPKDGQIIYNPHTGTQQEY